MMALWHYFWPVYALCVVVGLLAGARAFPRHSYDPREPARPVFRVLGLARRPRTPIAIGAGAALAVALLWYFPFGAAERMGQRIETIARTTLFYYELPMIQARLERRPMTRQLVLSGPADDFQRAELLRIMDEVPGVARASWDPASLPAEAR